jgi:hypothetical protein
LGLSAGDTDPAVIWTEQSGSESLCSLLNSGSGDQIRMSVRSGHRCVASGIHRKANELATGCKVRFFVRQTGEFQPELVASHRTELGSKLGTDRPTDESSKGSACGWQSVSADGTQYTSKGSP